MSLEPPRTRVKINHEHFIPVSKHKIRERLCGAVDEADCRKFRDFCRIIEAIYHFAYHETQEELKRDFVLFHPMSGADELAGFDEKHIDAAEMTFLSNFFTMMEKGNFTALTQEDYDIADEEDFLFSLPVKIDLDKLDDELLPRYFQEHPQVFDNYFGGNLPDYARRLMIFRRGVGVETFRGMLIMQKVDVLVGRFLNWLFAIPGRLFGGRKKEENTEESADIAETTQNDDSVEEDATEVPAVPSPAEGVPEPAEGRTVIFDDRYIDRITPRHVTQSPFSLLRPHTIQEPTFVQLVILFRYATPKPKGRRKPPPPKDRAIHIKQFRDIPMADLEVVYPEKRLSMKPIDLIKLAVTALIGIAIVTFKFALKIVTLGPVYAVMAMVPLIGYGAKVVVGWKNSRNRYEQLVTHALYHKNLDNDLGVVFFLMDSLEEQEFKEAVLGYYFLWRDGPMTEQALDEKCEAFLKEQFEVEVDFEVDDALEKLIDENLVSEVDGLYGAVGLLEACEILDEKWDNYFTYNNEKEAQDEAASSLPGMDDTPLSRTDFPGPPPPHIESGPDRDTSKSPASEWHEPREEGVDPPLSGGPADPS